MKIFTTPILTPPLSAQNRSEFSSGEAVIKFPSVVTTCQESAWSAARPNTELTTECPPPWITPPAIPVDYEFICQYCLHVMSVNVPYWTFSGDYKEPLVVSQGLKITTINPSTDSESGAGVIGRRIVLDERDIVHVVSPYGYRSCANGPSRVAAGEN